jgi:hypothetical protein
MKIRLDTWPVAWLLSFSGHRYCRFRQCPIVGSVLFTSRTITLEAGC